MRVVDTVRTTAPVQPRFSTRYFSARAMILCGSTNVPRSSMAPMRSASPSVTTPKLPIPELTAEARALRFLAIGSGWTLPKPGFISPRISATSQPVPCKNDLITPRPEPYMASTTKRWGLSEMMSVLINLRRWSK